jgi:hypothetical protein
VRRKKVVALLFVAARAFHFVQPDTSTAIGFAQRPAAGMPTILGVDSPRVNDYVVMSCDASSGQDAQ